MWEAIRCIAVMLIIAGLSLLSGCDVSRMVRGGAVRVETIVFGGSSVGAFSLIKDPRLKVIKIYGATARGLGKPQGPTRLKIIECINEYKPKRVILFFGMSDCYVSCMYKAAKGESPDYESIARDYVKFVQSLNVKRKTIICPHYSPIEDENVIASTARYIEVAEQDKKLMLPLISRDKRNAIVDTFNNTIKRMHPDTVDLNDFMAENGKIKKQFIVGSLTNFHARWNALLPYFEKICGYKAPADTVSKMFEKFKSRKKGDPPAPWSVSSFDD
jgi:hypothetical protein